MEEDGTLSVLSDSKGLFTQLTGRESPFKEALDLLQFAYTTNRVGAYVALTSTVLT